MHSSNIYNAQTIKSELLGHSMQKLAAYPLDNRQMSPVCNSPPSSPHNDMLIEPVLSATFTDLTSRPF